MEKIIYTQIPPETADLTPHINFMDDIYLKKGITDRLMFFNIYEDEIQYTDYERYAETIDLPEDVEKQLETEYLSRLSNRLHRLSRASKINSNEFHTHERSFREYILSNRIFSDPFTGFNRQQLKIKNNIDDPVYAFENLPGRNPLSWPFGLDDMLKKLKKLPFNTFFIQPFKFNSDFYPKLQKKYQEYLKVKDKVKNGENNFNVLIKIIEVELLVSLLNGSFYHVFFVLEKLKDLLKIIDAKQEKKLIEELKKTVGELTKEIIYDIDKVHSDFCPVPSQISKSFALAELKTSDFNIQDYGFATDGKYIYELVASNNCLQLNKIGTGNSNTEAGFVYLTKKLSIPLQKHSSIVYLQGKLYITNPNDKHGTVDVYNKETLEREQKIMLDIKKYLKNVHLVQYNKHFQIFTDGKNLYTLLLNVRFVKVEEEVKKEAEAEDKDGNVKHDQNQSDNKKSKEQKLNEDNANDESNEINTPSNKNTKNREPLLLKKKTIYPEPESTKHSFTFNIRKPEAKYQDILDKTSNIEELRSRIEKRIQEMERMHQENFEETMDFPADLEEFSRDAMEDKYMNLRSINLIKNIFKNSVIKGDGSENEDQRGLYFKNDRLNPFKKYDDTPSEFFYDYMEVNKISSRRNAKKAGDATKKASSVPNNGEKYFIDFYVLKFDINESEEKNKERKTNEIKKTPLLIELFESFSGLFSYENCERALQECGNDIQSAAELLIEKGDNNDKFSEYSPIEETLIYQTEAVNHDFRQTKIVKAFNVAPKSLLTPVDVMNATWFIKGHFLLKSTGQLFSIDPNDAIQVDPKDLEKDYADSFYKKRNSELNILLKEANLKPEYIDKLYSKLTEQLQNEGLYKGLVSRGVSETDSQTDKKILTTFIKVYDDVFFTNNINRKLTYDNTRHEFIAINFEKMPKSNYNFVREKFTYYNDNSKLTKMLEDTANIKPEYKKCPFLYYAEILNSMSINSFISSFTSFMLYVNVNRSNVQFRLNDWAWAFKEHVKTLKSTDKKKKNVYNSKIKKMNELKAKKFTKKSLSDIFSKKYMTSYYRELTYNHYLCVKGNLKTLDMLLRLYDKSSDELFKTNMRAFLKIIPQFLEFAHDKYNISKLHTTLLSKIIKSTEKQEHEELYLSLSYLFAQDHNTFIEVFQQLLYNNVPLLLKLFDQFFGDKELLNNKQMYNQRILLASNKNFSFDDNKEEQVKYSYSLNVKFTFFRIFAFEFNKTNYLEQLKDKLDSVSFNDKITLLRAIRKIVEILVIGISNTDDDKKDELKVELDPKEFIIHVYYYLHDLLQKLIDNFSIEKLSEKYIKEILNLQNIFISLTMKKQVQKNINIDKTLKYLFEYSQAFMNYFPTIGIELNNINGFINKLSKEGISQVESYIVETQHPIERGKNTIFKRIYNRDVLGYYLEFDKKCQDEENSDNLMISSWFYPEVKGTASTAQDMTFYKYVSIAGKKTHFNPLLMIGDTIDIQFISSQIAKNNVKSLNQWGYKIIVRPIYKGSILLKEIKIQDQILALRMCKNLESTAIVLRNLLDGYLKGFSICSSNNELMPYLEWNILHNGLYYLNKDKFIRQKENGSYQFIDDRPLKTVGLNSETNNSEKVSNKSKTLYDKISVFDEELEVDALLTTLKDKTAPVSELVSIIKSLRPMNIAYRAERQRPFFFKDLQILWDEVEEQIILCYLKHMGLLYLLKSQNKMDIKFLVEQQNIKDQLNNIAKNKDDIINFMLKEVQLEKEYNMLLDGVFEIIKEIVLTDFIKPRVAKIKADTIKPVVQEKPTTKERIKNIIRTKNKKKTKKPTPSMSVKEEVSKKESTIEEESKHYYFTEADYFNIISQQKIKDQMIKLIADRFDGNDENLIKIFVRKQMEYTKETKVNYEMILNNLLSVLKEYLDKSKAEDKYPMDLSFSNPYKLIAEKEQERCLFILKLETNKNMQINKTEDHEFPKLTLGRENSMQPDTEDLKPLGMGRSLTSDVKTTKRLQPSREDVNMRNWLDNYKNWKESMSNKEEDVRSKDCSPSFAVSKFLKIEENINVHEIEKIMLKCTHRATMRIIGMQNYRTAINLFAKTWLFSYFSNLSSSLYSDLSLFDNIKTTHADFKNIISTEAFSILNVLYKESNRIIRLIQNVTPSDLQLIKNKLTKNNEERFSENIEKFAELIQELLMLHTEIISLSNNEYYKKYISKMIKDNNNKNKTHFFCETLELMLQYMLFTKSMGNLSIDFRYIDALLNMSHKAVKIVCKTLTDVLNKNLSSLNIILECMQNELCLLPDMEQSKVFINKLNDKIGASRMICLLNILMKALKDLNGTKGYERFIKEKKLQNSIKKIVFRILYFSKNNTINQICCKILRILVEPTELKNFLLEKNYLNKFTWLNKDLPDMENNDKKITKLESIGNESNISESHNHEINKHNGLNNLDAVLVEMGNSLILNKHKEDKTDYTVLLYLFNEEDLSSLIRLLYYWEIRYPSLGLNLPSTIEEYEEYMANIDEKLGISDKKVKRIAKNEKEVSYHEQMPKDLKLKESIITSLPHYDAFTEADKNMGWYINFTDVFNGSKINRKQRTSVLFRSPKKIWDLKNLNKLIATLADLLKNLKTPKMLLQEARAKKDQQEKAEDSFKDGYELELLFNEDYDNSGQPSKDVTQETISNKLKEDDKILSNASIENQTESIQLEKRSSSKVKSRKSSEIIKLERQKHEEERKRKDKEFLELFRFLKIMLETARSVLYMASLLNYTGYTQLLLPQSAFKGTYSKAEEFTYMLNIFLHNKLKELDITFIKDENIVKKLQPVMKFVNTNVNIKGLNSTIVETQVSQLFADHINNLEKMKVPSEDLAKYLNKYNILAYISWDSKAKRSKVQTIAEFVKQAMHSNHSIKKYITENYLKILRNELLHDDLNVSKLLEIGYLSLYSNRGDNYFMGQLVKGKISSQNFRIISNKYTTGKDTLLAINEREPKACIKLDKESIQLQLVKTDICGMFKDVGDVLLCAFFNQIEEHKKLPLNPYEDDIDQIRSVVNTRFKLIVTMNIIKNLLEEKTIHLSDETIMKFQNELEEGYKEYEVVKNEFVREFENLLNITKKSYIVVPQKFSHPEYPYDFELERRKLSKNLKEIKQTNNLATLDNFAYTLSRSSYISDMRMSHPKSNDFRMLKHWEKHIIPKILNFVKGSLSAYEIEDFFEQMRIELRKENNAQASNIAYILCDQKLPNDCHLPELNYDWSTLDIDEITIGQYVSVKIKDDRHLYSVCFEQFNKLNITTVLGQVIFKDVANKCINVLVNDLALSNTFSVWVPQQAIRAIETPIDLPSNAYPIDYHLRNFENSFKQFYKTMMRNFVIEGSLFAKSAIDLSKCYKLFRLAIKNELKGNCLNEWMIVNGNNMELKVDSSKLNSLMHKIFTPNNVYYFIDQLSEEATNLIEFFSVNNYSCDLKNHIEDDIYTSNKIEEKALRLSKLNIFKNKEETSGIVIDFKKEANLFKCSGLKFFSDSEGINMLEHLQATPKTSVNYLQPLVFGNPNIYCQFYYNAEALPIYIQNQTTTNLSCSIFAIPFNWNYFLWAVDIMTTYASVENKTDLFVKIFRIIKSFMESYKGPSECKIYLHRLISRCLLKIKSFMKDKEMNLEVKNMLIEFLPVMKAMDDDFNTFLAIESEGLYPNALQEMSECIAIYTSVCEAFNVETGIQPSKCITDLCDIFNLAGFLYLNKGSLSERLFNLLKEEFNAKRYYNNFILIQNIPELKVGSVKAMLKEVISSNKLKVLLEDIDIYIPTDSEDTTIGYALILYDGWNAPNIDDMKITEDETEEKEEEPVERLWICEVCTLQNIESSTICIACEMPKPATPNYVEDETEEEGIEEEYYFSNNKRICRLKDSILIGFERLTADKRIEVKTFETNSEVKEFLESNEYLEFILNRITSDKFIAKLPIAAEELYKMLPESEKKNIGVENVESFVEYLKSHEPAELFETLFKYGFDFWLEKSCLGSLEYDQPKLINRPDITKFLEFCEIDICDGSAYIKELEPFNFRLEFKNCLKDVNIFDNDALAQLSYKESINFYYKAMKFVGYNNFEFRSTLAVVQQLNKVLTRSFKFINMKLIGNDDQSNAQPLSLGSLLAKIRDYYLSPFKNKIVDELLASTALARDETPKIIIERITKEKEIIIDKNNYESKNHRRKDKMMEDNKNSVFLQAYKQINEICPTMMRPVKPKGSEPFIAFEVIFKGEHVMGEAGPYRQFYADIASELQPNDSLSDFTDENKKKLLLLIPSPNKQSDTGDFKDKLVINPSCTSAYHLQLYEYLGLLMGCAFRTGTFLTLELPTIFWKKLVKQKILEEDIAEIDKGLLDLAKFIKQSSPDVFDDMIFETFTTYLSNKQKVELIPNGEHIKVNYDNRLEYIEKVVDTRINEANFQIEAIQRGLLKVIPQALFSCLTAKDLERFICGRNEVDFNLLKRHTRYSGGLKEDSELIKNFWSILLELSDKDKLKFVKFCWGQERLPSTSEAFENSSLRFMIKPAQYEGNQDGILPRADTCFFNFELPNYSTKEIMKEKILLAIHTDSDSMNAEERLSENNINYEEEISLAYYSDYSDVVMET